MLPALNVVALTLLSVFHGALLLVPGLLSEPEEQFT